MAGRCNSIVRLDSLLPARARARAGLSHNYDNAARGNARGKRMHDAIITAA